MPQTINTYLFDLDDTIIQMGAIFNYHIDLALNILCEGSHLPAAEMGPIFEAARSEARHIAIVDPEPMWHHAIQTVCTSCNLSQETYDLAYQKLMEIYLYPPTLMPGAIELLDDLRSRDKKLGLVTHAKVDWTHFKLDSVNIGHYFQHKEIVSVNRHKSAIDWYNGMIALDGEPETTFAAGDNLQGDIMAAHEAGIKNLFWINVPRGWNALKEGTLPSGAREFSSIGEVHQILRDNDESRLHFR